MERFGPRSISEIINAVMADYWYFLIFYNNLLFSPQSSAASGAPQKLHGQLPPKVYRKTVKRWW